MSDAYERGFAAYGSGWLREDCPFDAGISRKDWLRGWNAACYEIGEP